MHTHGQMQRSAAAWSEGGIAVGSAERDDAGTVAASSWWLVAEGSMLDGRAEGEQWSAL